MKIDKQTIYRDFLNIIDDDTLKSIIENRPNHIKYIETQDEEIQLLAMNKYIGLFMFFKKPNEKVQIAAVKKNFYIITRIKNPSETVQMEAVKNYKFESTFYFNQIYKKINSGLALNFLYKKTTDIEIKERIRKNPNYKNDAELILEKLNKINNLNDNKIKQ